MPLPKPRKDETKDDWIERCMSDEVMVKEFGQAQRHAVCQTRWGEHED